MENFWSDKRVFITGANGFLGSHLTKALLRQGNQPVVLIYDENPGAIFDQERLADQTRVVRGDIRNLKLIQHIYKEYNVDIVFHLAAQPIVDQGVDDPLTTFEVNIQGTWNILEAAKQYGKVKKLVVASSDKAYGGHDQLPYQEHSHHLKASFPYEVSKSCADLISQSLALTFKLPICITRCTNIYGGGDLKFNRLIPNTIRKLYYNQSPIIRDTGESLRDYVYIDDVVRGYLSLAEKMGPSMFREAFNLSTNQPLSVLEVIKIITHIMDKNIEPEIIRTRGLEIRHQYASYRKARNVLAWEPTHTFVEGVKKTIPWYLDYFKNVEAKS